MNARTSDNLCEHFLFHPLTPLRILALLSFEMKILIQSTQQLQLIQEGSGDKYISKTLMYPLPYLAEFASAL